MRDLADYDRAFGSTSIDAGIRPGRWPDGTQPRRIRSSRSPTYAAALKAPRIREAAARLADQARDAGWTPRGLPGRRPRGGRPPANASGARPAHPARRVPRPQNARGLRLRRPTRARPRQIARLGSGGVPDRSPQRRPARPARDRQNPPGHRARRSPPPNTDTGSLFATATDWVTRLTDAHRHGRLPPNWPSCAATG